VGFGLAKDIFWPLMTIEGWYYYYTPTREKLIRLTFLNIENGGQTNGLDFYWTGLIYVNGILTYTVITRGFEHSDWLIRAVEASHAGRDSHTHDTIRGVLNFI
jgi:hypothetical protein